jgi:hypothetical protein
MHAEKFVNEPQACELLICDEAHRLKNAQSQINQALAGTGFKSMFVFIMASRSSSVQTTDPPLWHPHAE